MAIGLAGLSLLSIFLTGGFNPSPAYVMIIGTQWTVGWLSGRGPVPTLPPLLGSCVGLNGTFEPGAKIICNVETLLAFPSAYNASAIFHVYPRNVTITPPFTLLSSGGVPNYGGQYETLEVDFQVPYAPGTYQLDGTVWFFWLD
jgi:hypothetical protein